MAFRLTERRIAMVCRMVLLCLVAAVVIVSLVRGAVWLPSITGVIASLRLALTR